MKDYLAEFSDYLQNSKKSSKNTIDSYIRDVRAFLTFALKQTEDVSEFGEVEIGEYIKSLETAGKSETTIVRALASIRCLYEFFIFNGVCSENPTAKIKVKRAEKKLPDVLTQKEVDTLLAQPNVGSLRGLRDKAMLELLYATGLRVSELIDLRVDDVNLQVSIITCRTGKTERVVPVYKSALKAIEGYLEAARSVLVTDKGEKSLFVNMNGTKMTRQGFWKIIKGYAGGAGITKSITPHTIRHSFAAHLLEGGAGIKDIKDLLGHSGISSTQVYLQVVERKYEQGYTKFHPKAGK